MQCKKCKAKLVTWECVVCKTDNTPSDSKPIIPNDLAHKIWAVIDARRETGLERQIYYENIVDQVDELIDLVDTYGIK